MKSREEVEKLTAAKKFEYQQREPAFPQIESGERTDVWSAGGLTKREYFAIKILQGLISNPEHFSPKSLDLVVDARQYADALIAELNK